MVDMYEVYWDVVDFHMSYRVKNKNRLLFDNILSFVSNMTDFRLSFNGF